ncbi:threonine-phosphate decarboxylase CobD [Pseudomonas sp. RIT-PI-AD]|uniref:threonine-phosphate decarboxylase CobD n=1 Tax=Pseudomonas sp. RIT-PI-AD TaxID=3035294 RepID=UPI0021DB7AE8|nr:threonine-phosphate decarboxylase CobD [Pseudomonas sp. RIT-PI-AD]
MLEHGGRLRAAAQAYGIPLAEWLDLSSGLAPYGWPLPDIPARAWTRLPEGDDGLERVAAEYYGAPALLPVAGSQAAIQALPRLRPPGRVGVLSPCYAEHAAAWRREGHSVVELDEAALDACLDGLDVLVAVNPNNPTGRLIAPPRLLDWHARLAARGGWLLLDEAFMDPTPAFSLAAQTQRPGLIVLRSFGKFFGLAGARLGFVLAEPALLEALEEWLGPWCVAGPTRAMAAPILADGPGQRRQRERLRADGERLAALLAAHGLAPAGGCALFQWWRGERAAELHHYLARRGILVRLFAQPASLRFGLPPDAVGWSRLRAALSAHAEDTR